MAHKKSLSAQIALLILGSGVLAGCSTAHVSQNNKDNLKKIDNESHQLMSERLEKESKKFLDENKRLFDKIEDVSPKKENVMVVEPEFNPLDAVKITVNADNTDAQSILQAIADQAGMSLLLDPQLSEIKRKISMNLKNVPASLVFEQVMELLDFHGVVKGNVLIVRPFEQRVYELNFLQTATSIDYNMGGDVFGANSNVGSSGGGGGSSSNSMKGDLSFSGTGAEESNPYKQLQKTLENVLGKNANAEDDEEAPGTGQQNSRIRLPQAAEVTPKTEVKAFSPTYSLNEMTGTLFLKARPSHVEAIDQLISQYKKVLGRQVLIEAQLLDVRLTEGNRHGINWDKLSKDIAMGYGGPISVADVNSVVLDGSSNARAVTIPAIDVGNTGSNAFRYARTGDTFAGAIDMMQQYGAVRVLSNPSIRAKNSRPAFISVGTNEAFISETSTTRSSGDNGYSTTDITTSSVFDGIVLGFEPFIEEDGNISLTIHPMQSSVDPDSMELVTVGTGDNATQITLPKIDFKGLTTSLKLNDGDTVILGGLMDEVADDSGRGLPGLNEIPGIGSLFGGQRSAQKSSREFVMVLRVTRL
ncbi:MAG: pilus (MSHA type) biogenesis protein MshL [Hydrogenovibrio sp.]|uniref:pilus (MSHA type) biogenesis protein MshL n=1 Tax=Hydrogenovibrio sp. TaxID=2065821 RepID=UPI00286FC18E|nr:pilus (MSHA type) biogenesis protein MshL [Hydrogenovibrio sp.]MDR9497822.1 pilus (MSHA type) biogenesis protein MshL [Hydrogenovibrio sp.]